jgi:hypothetical protein
MKIDHIRERDLERVGMNDMKVMSDGITVKVDMRAEDFDRLIRLARGARDYWEVA